MYKHIRANLWLLALTLFVCCVVYPLVLWAVGQAACPTKAEGSLIESDGKPVGSRLIAQPFGGDEYFQPRPSAASYNAAASGASNWAASNYLLRDRVARQVGPVVKYRGTSPTGRTVQQDVEDWFAKEPDVVSTWADQHSGVAQAWVNADDKHKAAVTKWREGHPEAVAEWKKANPDGGEPKPADLAVPFFKSNAAAFQKAWPKLIDDATWSVPAVFFDLWLQQHADAKLEPVPADLVTTSGSGLDPHITLAGAHYQLDRVAGKWAETTKRDPAQVRKEIEDILRQKSEAPLGGLAGVELVNVLEVNLALREQFGRPAQAAR
jgi:K+-transporting ATPase ATPase C chain